MQDRNLRFRLVGSSLGVGAAERHYSNLGNISRMRSETETIPIRIPILRPENLQIIMHHAAYVTATWTSTLLGSLGVGTTYSSVCDVWSSSHDSDESSVPVRLK
jgi:hypothetical protein